MIWHYLFYVFNSFQIPVCLMQKYLAQMDPIFRKGPFFYCYINLCFRDNLYM